jgi:hypothetical protein
MTASLWSNLSSDGAKGACQKRKPAAIGAPLPEQIGLFPGSSVVEQLTVNQLVGGSNPSRGAIFSGLDSPLHQTPSLPKQADGGVADQQSCQYPQEAGG